MAKEHVGRTKTTATKTLYAVMKEISCRGGSMPAKASFSCFYLKNRSKGVDLEENL
jgi:hypothetical protein